MVYMKFYVFLCPLIYFALVIKLSGVKPLLFLPFLTFFYFLHLQIIYTASKSFNRFSFTR